MSIVDPSLTHRPATPSAPLIRTGGAAPANASLPEAW